MVAARQLEALGRRHGISREAVGRLGSLLELVVSDPRSPTAVRDPIGVLNDHLADSLVALGLSQLASARRIVDIGSGAGFPGIPLAIALPAAEFTLLESASRKCAFLEAAVAACGLENVQVAHARAETWPQGLGGFDVATARALAPIDVVLEYAAPLLAVGGHVIAWRGRRDPADEVRASKAAAQLGLRVDAVIPVLPYRGAEHRHLHLATKVSATPPRFPRRPGVARKRPLGGRPANARPRLV